MPISTRAGACATAAARSLPDCRRPMPRRPASSRSKCATTTCSAISSRSRRCMALRSPSRRIVELFIHRQTLANAVRFSTPELAALEARITQAADRALALELEIFTRLVASVLAERRRSLPRAPLSPSSTTTPGLPSLPSRRAMCVPRSTRASSLPSRTGATRWSSRPCGAMTASISSATTAGLARATMPTPASSS